MRANTRLTVALCGLGILLLIGPPGCGKKKFTESQKTELATAKQQARDRATTFAVVKDTLKAADEKEQFDLVRYSNGHQEQLNATALALHHFDAAVTKGSPIQEAGRAAIGELAKATTASADAFRKLVPRLTLTAAQVEWSAAHQRELDSLANRLTKLDAELKAKEK